MAHTDRPSPKQQRYLRSLAEQTGTSFTPPRTRAQASREIDRLKKLSASPRHERSEDLKAVDEGLGRRGGDAAVRRDEVSGFGSSARWR
jgi:Protein of unknown function (DUF3072)